MTLVLSLVLAVPDSAAHRPHTVVPAVIVPDDFATTGEAWLVAMPGPISSLLRTRDGGKHWDYVGGPPTADLLVAGAADGETLVFLSEEGRLWTSTDGNSWTATPIPGGAGMADLEVHDGAFLATGAGGLWMGNVNAPADAVLLNDSAPFIEVGANAALGLDYAAAVRSDGVVWLASGDRTSFVHTGAPPAAGITEVAFSSNQLYSGGANGIFRWSRDQWEPCAALPTVGAGTFVDVVSELAQAGDGRLLAATGEQAVFVARDDCAGWDLVDMGAPMTPIYGAVGYASTAQDAFSLLWEGGGTLLAAGFNGIAIALPPPSDVVYPKLVSADYIRGISVSENGESGGRLMVAHYGGGVAWSNDGAETWTGAAVGIGHLFGYDLDDLGGGTVLYAALTAYRSTDDGASFSVLPMPMERTRTFVDFGDRVLALGENVEGQVYGRLAVSTDRGARFTPVPAFAELVGPSAPSFATVDSLRGTSTWLVTTDGPPAIAASTDEGASWRWLRTTDTDVQLSLSAGVEVWPAGAGTRIVHANEIDGVVFSDDGGNIWVSAATQPTSPPLTMEQFDDTTLLIGTGDGFIFRSTDGGENWARVASGIPSPIHAFSAAPGFADHQIGYAATSVGVYFTDDGGSSWRLLRRFERMESGTFHVGCETLAAGACVELANPTLGGGSANVIEVGDKLSFTFEGDRFRVIGPASGSGGLSVEVDGVRLADWIPDGTAFESPMLPMGWHDVALLPFAAAPGGISIDAVETYGPGETVPRRTDDTGTPTDTGIAGDSGDSGPDSGAMGSDTADSAFPHPNRPSGRTPTNDCGGCMEGTTVGFAGLLPLSLWLRQRRRPRIG